MRIAFSTENFWCIRDHRAEFPLLFEKAYRGHCTRRGSFAVEPRQKEALEGDLGLVMQQEARHYGLVRRFPAGPVPPAPRGALVVQYEAQFQNDLHCGGACPRTTNLCKSSTLAVISN